MTAVGIVIAAVVAVGGWFVVNALAAQRERRNDRRDYRAKFLIDAWVTLEDAAQRENSSRLPALESAIAKIQLLGSARQIELVQAFAVAMAKESGGSVEDLLADLRHDLRAELELEPITGAMLHIRVKP